MGRPLIEILDCRTGSHCLTCRDLEGGRGWRASLAAAAPEAVGGEVDFACPLELPWGATARATLGPGESTSPPTIAPEPKPWPWGVRMVARQRDATDAGVGDTLKRLLGDPGEAFEDWFRRVVGRPCGCGDRVLRLNQMYPYAGEDRAAGDGGSTGI